MEQDSAQYLQVESPCDLQPLPYIEAAVMHEHFIGQREHQGPPLDITCEAYK